MDEILGGPGAPDEPSGLVIPGRPLAADLTDLFEACYDDPTLFFEEVLRCTGEQRLRRWQREVLDEIGRRRQAGEEHTQVHIRAAHGAGKGFLAAGCTLWWNATRPGSRTLTTAPTWRGVEELLWSEIRKLYQGSLLAEMRHGRMLDTKWDMGYGWFAVGASSDHPENLEGQHSLIAAGRIVDEAKAVDDGVFTATEGLLSSRETFDLWISTPSTRTGAFYKRDLKGGPRVIRKVVTIEDLIADNVPGAARWKEQALLEYGGEHSFEYRSRAMGEYIDDAEGALFPFSWIERAMFTDEERAARGLPIFHVSGAPTLGFDVAGSVDGDENATAPAYGPNHLEQFEIGALDHWHQRDTMISKDRVIETARNLAARCVRGDVQGLGKGVLDAMSREIFDRSLPFYVEEYRSADPAEDSDRFLNRKAENAWYVRLALEKDRIRIAGDDSTLTLREQMAAMKYEVRNGKIRVVDPKDSPDHADALIMAIGEANQRISVSDIAGGGEVASWGPHEKHLGWTRGS